MLRVDCAASAAAPSNTHQCYPMAQASGNAFDWLAFASSLHVVLQQKLSLLTTIFQGLALKFQRLTLTFQGLHLKFQGLTLTFQGLTLKFQGPTLTFQGLTLTILNAGHNIQFERTRILRTTMYLESYKNMITYLLTYSMEQSPS